MNTVEVPARPPINWPTVLFIAGTTLAAAAWPLYAWHFGVTGLEIVLAVVFYFATGMAITVGYHRLIAHQTFKAHPLAKAILLFFGAAAWQGSALEWSLDHIQHHSHIDTEADPYNRRRGFLYSHIGWLVRRQFGAHHARIPHFLKNDRLVMFQHRYYVPIALTGSFLLPVLLCGWGGLLLVGAVRIVAVHHTTWFINSWAHTGKSRPYNPDVTAADHWLLAVLAFGEGWHNYHHAFPNDYRNGVGRWDWDPSKWLIQAMARLGVAYDLKRVQSTTIWSRRVEALLAYEGCPRTRAELLEGTRRSLDRLRARKEAQLARFMARLQVQAAASQADLQEVRQRLAQRMDEWKRLRDERSLARAHRMEALIDQLTVYRGLLERLGAPTSSSIAA